MKIVVASAIGLALTGCELIAPIGDVRYEPVDSAVDAMTSSLDASTVDEAPSEADVVGNGDAGVDAADVTDGDASSSDSSDVGPDPATSAPDAGTVDPSAPCGAQPANAFCDDFELSAAAGTFWDFSNLVDGGALALSSLEYTSANHSMLASSPPSSSGSVSVGKSFGTASKQIRVAFDLWLNVPSYAGLPLFAVAQINGTAAAAKTVSLNAEFSPTDGFHLQAFVDSVLTSLPLPPPPLKQWTRIVVVYDVTSGVSVLENGTVVATDPTGTLGALSNLMVQVGIAYAEPPATRAVDLRIDNVVVTKP